MGELTGNHLLWSVAALVALIAGVTDWRSRRIPNWLTVPGAALGLTLHFVYFGWAGAKSSLEGLGLAMLILFPFVALRAFGYGDWKLVGASGAILGVDSVFGVFFVAALVMILHFHCYLTIEYYYLHVLFYEKIEV